MSASRSAIVVLANAEGNINGGALRRMTVPVRPAPPRDTTRPSTPVSAGDARPVPHVAGVTATEQAAMLLRQLQAGQVDRAALAPEGSADRRRWVGPLSAVDAGPSRSGSRG